MDKEEAAYFFEKAGDLADNCAALQAETTAAMKTGNVRGEKRSATTLIEAGKKVSGGEDIPPPVKFHIPQFFWESYAELDDGKDFIMRDGEVPSFLQIDPAKETEEHGKALMYKWKSSDGNGSQYFWYLSDCKASAYHHASKRKFEERCDKEGEDVTYDIDVEEVDIATLKQDSSLFVKLAAQYCMYRQVCSFHNCLTEECASIHGQNPKGRLLMWKMDRTVLERALLKMCVRIFESSKFKETLLYAVAAANKTVRCFTPREVEQMVKKFFLFNCPVEFLHDMMYYVESQPEMQAFTINFRRAIEKVRDGFNQGSYKVAICNSDTEENIESKGAMKL